MTPTVAGQCGNRATAKPITKQVSFVGGTLDFPNVRVNGDVAVSKFSARVFVFSLDTHSVGIWKDISSAGPEF